MICSLCTAFKNERLPKRHKNSSFHSRPVALILKNDSVRTIIAGLSTTSCCKKACNNDILYEFF